MADLPRFEQRMTDAEGLMWRMEKDPHLSSTFANVTILDRAPDIDRLRQRMANAVLIVPRLRHRVMAAPANLSAPLWVEDSDFDLDYHVRHISLPKPGSIRQLLDYATLVANDPFDRTRPLWQFVVVEGLKGRRAALIEKLHHTIADGETSVKLSLQFLDMTRDAPMPPPPDPDAIDIGPHAAEPSSAEAFRDLVAGSMRLPLGLVRQLKDLVADPSQLPEAGAAAIETLRSMMTQLSEVDGAHSPLWTARSLRRRLETLRAPLEETKVAAKRLGGSLNTAFLTAATHGAAAYHRELGSAGRLAAGVDGREHAHRLIGVECVLARPDVGADAVTCRSPIASRPSPALPMRPVRRRRRARSMRSRGWPRPCRPRW